MAAIHWLTFRTATPADVPALVAIHAACCREITRRLGDGHWSLEPTRESVLTAMECRTVYVALLGTAPVATVTVSQTPASFWPPAVWTEPEADALCVFGLAVLPEHQRRGIGAWMMSHIEDMAADAGHRWVRLDAYTANPRAQRFYRKLGYAARGEVALAGTRLTCFEKSVGAPGR